MLQLLEAIVVFLAFFMGGRNIATYQDFIKLNIPAWLRKILFITDVRSEKISLVGIIYQLIVIVMMAIYILNFIGLNVFAEIGEFEIIYFKLIKLLFFAVGIPMVVYTCICEFVLKRK